MERIGEVRVSSSDTTLRRRKKGVRVRLREWRREEEKREEERRDENSHDDQRRLWIFSSERKHIR